MASNTITGTVKIVGSFPVRMRVVGTNAWASGVLDTTTGNYVCTLGNVPAGNYAPGTIQYQLLGSNPDVSAFNTNLVVVTGPQSQNQKPSVSFSPSTSSAPTVGVPKDFLALATDADGSIVTVDLVQVNSATDSTVRAVLASDNTSPYSLSWVPVTAGTVYLAARATDNSGETSLSSVLTLTVNAASSGGSQFYLTAIGTSLFTPYPGADTETDPFEYAYLSMSKSVFPEAVQNVAIPNSTAEGLLYQLTNRVVYKQDASTMLLAVDNLINDIFGLVQMQGYTVSAALTTLQNRWATIRDEAVRRGINKFALQTTARAAAAGNSTVTAAVYELSVAFSDWIRANYTTFWPGKKILIDLAKNRYVGLGSTEVGYVLTNDLVHWTDKTRQLVGGLYAEGAARLAAGETDKVITGELIGSTAPPTGGGTTPPPTGGTTYPAYPTEAQLPFTATKYGAWAFSEGRYGELAASGIYGRAITTVQDGQINNVIQTELNYVEVDSAFICAHKIRIAQVSNTTVGYGSGTNAVYGTTRISGQGGIEYGLSWDGNGALSKTTIGNNRALLFGPAVAVGDEFTFEFYKTKCLIYRGSDTTPLAEIARTEATNNFSLAWSTFPKDYIVMTSERAFKTAVTVPA
jgi:hypothetical protein